MTKSEVIEKLLQQNKELKDLLSVGQAFRKDTDNALKAIESNNKTIAEIAKTLES